MHLHLLHIYQYETPSYPLDEGTMRIFFVFLEYLSFRIVHLTVHKGHLYS